MKIFSVNQTRKGDEYTINNEAIASIDLMERAAGQLYKWIINNTGLKAPYAIFCGLGNNGGDGLALARMLSEGGTAVRVFILNYSINSSVDFNINLKRLKSLKDVTITELRDNSTFPEITANEIIVDAIFGSGLSKPVKGFTGQIVKEINSCKNLCISIDSPSGLFSDKSSLNQHGEIIKANHTLTIQLPKYSFMFAENHEFTGHWHVLPIGIHQDYIEKTATKNILLEEEDITPLLLKRSYFDHKGHYGHALLVAGSQGKMGAAVLGAEACMRSGSGLLTANIPKEGYEIMQTAVPEAMVELFAVDTMFMDVRNLGNYNAIAVGPGIGMQEETQQALKLLIQNAGTPIIFDADAINILGENKTWLPFIPPGSIFTPHPKEFERLTGKTRDQFERNDLQRDFSFKYNAIVVLKGANSSITFPDGSCWFNSTGNPGMATGGSGDVLTGIILGLKARGYPSEHAAILGTYIHGIAGDLAAKDVGEESLIASDIIDYLPDAFQLLYR